MAIERKTVSVLVRMAPTQYERFRRIAENEGRRLPEWLREIALRSAAAAEAKNPQCDG